MKVFKGVSELLSDMKSDNTCRSCVGYSHGPLNISEHERTSSEYGTMVDKVAREVIERVREIEAELGCKFDPVMKMREDGKTMDIEFKMRVLVDCDET